MLQATVLSSGWPFSPHHPAPDVHFDLPDYIVGKANDALFLLIGEKEQGSGLDTRLSCLLWGGTALGPSGNPEKKLLPIAVL